MNKKIFLSLSLLFLPLARLSAGDAADAKKYFNIVTSKSHITDEFRIDSAQKLVPLAGLLAPDEQIIFASAQVKLGLAKKPVREIPWQVKLMVQKEIEKDIV